MKSSQSGFGAILNRTMRNVWKFGTTGQYISYPSNANFNIGTNAFTLECWVRFSSVIAPTAGANAFMQASTNMASATGPVWFGVTGTSGQPFNTLWLGQHGGGNVSGGVAWTPQPGVWYHLAVYRTGSTNCLFFVNGQQQGATQSIAANYTGQAGWAIGSLTTSPSGIPFQGEIADVRYTLGAGLVPYLGNFTPPVPGTLTAPNASGVQILALSNASGNTNVDSSTSTTGSLVTTTGTNNGTVTASAVGIRNRAFGSLPDAQSYSTTFLLHGEPQAVSSVFVDSARNQAITRTGAGTTISATQFKFDTTSVNFTGAVGNYLSTAASLYNSMGTGNFTYEFWMWPDSTSNTTLNIPLSNFVHPIVFTTNAWGFYYNRTGNTKTMAIFCFNANNSTPIIESAGGLITDQAWNHIALVRNGTTLTLYINGTSAGSFAINATSWDSGASLGLYVGAGSTDGTNAYPFKGFIDEVRVSKVARWTANFTAPSAEYADLPLG